MNVISGFLLGFGIVSLSTNLIESYRARKGKENKIPLTKSELSGILIYSGITLIGAVGIFFTTT